MKWTRLLVLLPAIALLSACGGGGGSQSQHPDAPTKKTAPTISVDATMNVIEKTYVSIVPVFSDSDGYITDVKWQQVAGPAAEIVSESNNRISFNVPAYDAGNDLQFKVTATDSNNLSATKTIDVIVFPRFGDAYFSHGYSYSDGTLNQSSVYLKLAATQTAKYRVVLRSEVGDADLEIYSSETMNDKTLVAASYNPGSQNDTLLVNAKEGESFYLKISAKSATDYSLSINTVSPYLEPGFPVETYTVAGIYDVGDVVVGNIDSDPKLEILASGFSYGPLYAWHADGSIVDGWPVFDGGTAAYPSIGKLVAGSSENQVAVGYGLFAASCNYDKYLFTGAGTVMSGWPITGCMSGEGAPTLIDLNGDSVDEIIFYNKIYSANGDVLYPWTSSDPMRPGALHAVDLYGDGKFEFVFDASPETNHEILAYDTAGNMLPGFPTNSIEQGMNLNCNATVFGDVNGDGKKEIIRLCTNQANSASVILQVISDDGKLLWSTTTPDGVGYLNSSALSLADLDGDGVPEILVQTDQSVYVWKGDGSSLAGWPVKFANTGDPTDVNYHSSPLVGDVTGDQSPDVVITSRWHIYVYSKAGKLEYDIPADSLDRTQAIADLDQDGRNEIIVASTKWHGHSEFVDTVWAYDLGGNKDGPILWGQAGGDSRHTMTYPTKQ